MSVPLSQLMQSDDPDVGPPTATHDICLAPKLWEDLQAATEQYTDLEGKLEVARQNAEDPDRPRPGRRVGTKSDLKQLEQDAEAAAVEADEIRKRMADRSVTLHLRVDEDAWAALTLAHPARDVAEDPTGARLDRAFTANMCNVDELVKVLPTFISAYGDEKAVAGAWDYIKASSALGDRRMAASKVTQLHTQGVDLGKSRTALRSSRRTSADSE